MPNTFSPKSQRSNFTIVANEALRDPRISYRAKGILAAALTHADGFKFDKEWIVEHGTEGRDAITTCLKELRGFGYLRNVKQRNGQGRITGEHFEFCDCPDVSKTGGAAEPLVTPAENQDTGNPDAGFSGAHRRPLNPEDQKKPPLSPLPSSSPAGSRLQKLAQGISSLALPDWLEPYREQIAAWQERRLRAHPRELPEVTASSLRALEYARSKNCLGEYCEHISEKSWISLGFGGQAKWRRYIDDFCDQGQGSKRANTPPPMSPMVYDLDKRFGK